MILQSLEPHDAEKIAELAADTACMLAWLEEESRVESVRERGAG